MRITDNGPVAEQNLFGGFTDPFIFLCGVTVKVTAAATLGTVNVIARWVDPQIGATSHTTSVLLTAVNNYKSDPFWVDLAQGEYITIECTVTSLVGSPSYQALIGYCQGGDV